MRPASMPVDLHVGLNGGANIEFYVGLLLFTLPKFLERSTSNVDQTTVPILANVLGYLVPYRTWL